MVDHVQSFLDNGWEIVTTPVKPEDYGINQEQIQVDEVKETKNPNDDGKPVDLSEFMIEVVRVIAMHYYMVVILL